MGVEGLREFLNKLSKDKGYPYEEDKHVSNFKNITIAIDSSALLHTIFHGKKKPVVARMDPSIFGGKYNDEYFENEIFKEIISTLINTIIFFYNNTITPIFVFEMKNNMLIEAKKDTSTKRKHNGQKNLLLYEELIQLPYNVFDTTLVKNLRSSYVDSRYLSNDVILRVMEFLNKLLIPTILCSCEGENMCVKLAKEDIVDAVYSKDTDCYLMGCRYIIRDINIQTGMLSIVYYSVILQLVDLSPLQFRDFCILCGTDFGSRVPKFGPAGIYSLMKSTNYTDISSLYGKIKPRSGGYVFTDRDFECVNYEQCLIIFNTDYDIFDYTIESNNQFNDIYNKTPTIFIYIDYDIIVFEYIGENNISYALSRVLNDRNQNTGNMLSYF